MEPAIAADVSDGNLKSKNITVHRNASELMAIVGKNVRLRNEMGYKSLKGRGASLLSELSCCQHYVY